MSSKIVVIGNVVADIVAWPVDDVPRTGSLHPAGVAYYAGGCANNVALVLARLGHPVEVVACVGQDALGQVLLAGWQAAGIDTQHIVQDATTATGVTIVLVDSGGERRFISTPGANQKLTADALPLALLDDAFALHIAGFFTMPGLEEGALLPILRYARERGVLTVLDPVGGSARERREQLLALLPSLDMLLLNEDEGARITDSSDPNTIAAICLARGVPTVIVKEGTAGSRVYGKYGPLTIPAYPVPTVDSTGAGDAYAAALLASLARGDRFAEAMQWATAAGAATVTALGATGTWQGWDDLAKLRGWGYVPHPHPHHNS